MVGTKSLLRHGSFQQAFTIGTEFAMDPDLAGAHLGVAVGLLAASGEALQLDLTSTDHALADLS